MSRASNVEGRNKTFTQLTVRHLTANKPWMSRDHSVQSASPTGVG
jgi:hypothetical protein